MPARKNESNEIKINRIYDAPLKLVWEAWTDPKKAAKWWGPRGFTLTTHSKELKAGGQWIYTMHGPDGVDYPNITTYHQVEKHSRLVYDHGANENQPPMFKVDVKFSEVKGKTIMEMRMIFATPEVAKETGKFIKKAGGNSTWDRLAEYVEEEQSGQKKFVINRSFSAPIDVMFEMWTNPEHFSKWLAPTGFSMEFLKADIKAGGKSSYMMTNGEFKMFGSASYMEIVKPDRLVYTQQFNDDKGNVSMHPGAPLWPETMKTTVTFTSEGPDQTRVTVVWEVYGKATQAEHDAFVKERGGMTQGWTGSFDKLDDYIAENT